MTKTEIKKIWLVENGNYSPTIEIDLVDGKTWEGRYEIDGHGGWDFVFKKKAGVKTKRYPLTKKQLKIYEVLKKDNTLSYDEIARKVGLKAASTVHEHISILQRKGYIEKEAGVKRSLIVK